MQTGAAVVTRILRTTQSFPAPSVTPRARPTSTTRVCGDMSITARTAINATPTGVVDKKVGKVFRRQAERQRVTTGNDGSTETIRNFHATDVLCHGPEHHRGDGNGAAHGRGAGRRQLASGDSS